MRLKSALDAAIRKTGKRMNWLSEQTGIPPQTLSGLRTKRLKRDMYLGEAEKIAQALGIDISELGDSHVRL